MHSPKNGAAKRIQTPSCVGSHFKCSKDLQLAKSAGASLRENILSFLQLPSPGHGGLSCPSTKKSRETIFKDITSNICLVSRAAFNFLLVQFLVG
jgi:hypothetical protein